MKPFFGFGTCVFLGRVKCMKVVVVSLFSFSIALDCADDVFVLIVARSQRSPPRITKI